RIVEISVETRQDYIDVKEIKRLRKFGVTKVEIGAQALDDEILRLNRRGHDVAATIMATRLLKDAGFKVAYQMMANLPGSNLAKDKKMFEELFENPDFRPDYLKIYPLALVKNSGVYSLYQRTKFKPYSKKQLLNLIKYIKSIVPYYLRIERIIRDIPTSNIIEGGAKISNLRQIVQAEMKNEGLKCRCIRCREVRNRDYTKFKPYLFIEEYEASKGKEFFLSFETRKQDKIFSMLRLRFPADTFLPELKKAAIIREVHTYGQQLPISKNDKLASQHQGLGKKLIKEAEKIAKKNRFKKIAVISGVGVRPYFRKLGYKLKVTYMMKNLC
ncbi:tRNA uridine(34) 5-carboxymethylaminomethyl modification radical SAM/GNAT enzyme Elp3, partial [Patescibacteria group bacterium]|nr:tRNA uridine(34) 5-carboxymethylaminomethyl modification radical SAM/GNAT enzyme Elp3 [Patescibacteria group bacterium]